MINSAYNLHRDYGSMTRALRFCLTFLLGRVSKRLKIGAVTLAPSTVSAKSSGLTFHYPPYAVGPYAEGGYVAFVPWETLKPYLAPEGDKIFGGARPKSDEDGQQ
jgi:Protein of unknown function (DUF3298)